MAWRHGELSVVGEAVQGFPSSDPRVAHVVRLTALVQLVQHAKLVLVFVVRHQVVRSTPVDLQFFLHSSPKIHFRLRTFFTEKDKNPEHTFFSWRLQASIDTEKQEKISQRNKPKCARPDELPIPNGRLRVFRARDDSTNEVPA